MSGKRRHFDLFLGFRQSLIALMSPKARSTTLLFHFFIRFKTTLPIFSLFLFKTSTLFSRSVI